MRLKLLLLALVLLVTQGCEFGSGPGGPGGGTGGDGLTLTGVLQDPQGQALIGAKVRLYPEEYALAKGTKASASTPQPDSTVTDSTGHYRFTQVAAGRYNLQASVTRGDSVYSVFVPDIYVGADKDLGVSALATSGSLQIQIVDADHRPLLGAHCYVVGGAWESASDQTGNCTLTGLAPGRYRILVTYPGLVSAVTSNVTVLSGQSTMVAGAVRLLAADSGTDTTWTVRYDVDGENFGSMAWSGSMLVATGGGLDVYGEPYAILVTSPDGLTWTKRDFGGLKSLGKVMWAGNQFLTIGENSRVLTSPDGVSWTVRNAIDSVYPPYDVAWTGTKFVAVGWQKSWVSTDGVVWTDSTTNLIMEHVTCSANLCVGLSFSPYSPYTSTNGLVWTQRNAQTSNSLDAVGYNGSQWVVVGENGTIRTSSDGITWEKRVSGTTSWLSSIEWVNERWVVNNGILYSQDGILWLPGAYSYPGYGNIISIGARSVALGDGKIYTSP